MPICDVTILHVHGYSSTGGPQPDFVRVLGTATFCTSVSLTATNPSLTPTTGSVGSDDRFRLEVPVAGLLYGDPIGTITVTGNGSPPCSDTYSGPLKHCELVITTAHGLVGPGALTPNAIRVTGAVYGCASDDVTLTITNAAGNAVVNPLTGKADHKGSFAIDLPLVMPLGCNDEIVVVGRCAGNLTCADGLRASLVCDQCFRAELSYTSGPCTGAKPNQKQPITFTAKVGFPAGETREFTWEFGDGQSSGAGPPITNTGTSASVYTISTTHDYDPGTYTARLAVVPPPFECDPVELQVVADCDRCPTVTAKVAVGPCETTGLNTGKRQATYTIGFNPPLQPNDTAYASISYGGADATGQTNSGMLSRTGPGDIVHKAHFPPKLGGFASTVTVTIVDANNVSICIPPLPPIPVQTDPTNPGIVDVPTCLPCPQGVNCVVLPQPSPPLPSPHVRLMASVDWGVSAPPPPPYPIVYDFTVTLPGPGAQLAQQTVTTAWDGTATVDTSTGWNGPGALASHAIDLSAGGAYSVSVTAKYASIAGLPEKDGVVMCNLTGGTKFDVTGPEVPQECAHIDQLAATSAGCADPTQNIASVATFTANVTNPGGVVGGYHWDFGDSLTAQTTVNTVAHTYATPGTYLVKVSAAGPDNTCLTTAQATISIGLCSCPPGQERAADGNCQPTSDGGDGGKESIGCLLLRWIAVLLIVAGLFFFIIWLCVLPHVQGAAPWLAGLLLGIALGLIAAGIIVLLIWVLVCPVKPCLWVLLVAWQVLLGFGLVSLYFTICCWWLWIVGAFALLLAATGMVIWIVKCKPTFCQVIIELAPILANVIAAIGLVAIVPVLRACLNPVVGAVVGGVSGILVIILATCALTGAKTKTGPPAG